MIGDLGDSRFILSILEYNYRWLCGNYDSYWDGFFMYPDQDVISYSDNLLGAMPVYLLFRITGMDVFTVFQLTLVTFHLLNFFCCYHCFYKLSGNRHAAACGAFIFAFSLALNGMHNHPQYIFRFCIPLFFYFLYHYLQSRQLKPLLLAVFFMAWQFYLGVYLGYFLVIAAGAFVVSFFIVSKERAAHLAKFFLQCILAAAVLILLLLPIFYFYYLRSKSTGYYTDYDFYMQTLPRFSSYFKAFGGSILWDSLSNIHTGSKYEWVQILFPGALVFVSIAITIYFAIKKDRLQLLLLLTLFIVLAFTIYVNGHTLYGYLMKLPGIKAVRIVSRCITVLLFFCGWSVCLNLRYIEERFPDYRKSVLLALPLVLLLDNFCHPNSFKTYSKEESRTRIAALKEKITRHPGYSNYKAFAYIPAIKKDAAFYQIDAMLCALELKMKTVNGYSSSSHRFYGPFSRDIDSLSLAKWCTAMKLPAGSVLLVK